MTEPLNRQWYERNSGNAIKDVQLRVQHPVVRWMAATLDGMVEQTGAVFEAKFMLPWSFSEEGAAAKYIAPAPAQYVGNEFTEGGALDHHRRRQMGGDHHSGRSALPAPPVAAAKKFWRCVENGDQPRLYWLETPRPRLEAVRIVDMSELECLGRIRRPVLPDPAPRLCSTRTPRRS